MKFTINQPAIVNKPRDLIAEVEPSEEPETETRDVEILVSRRLTQEIYITVTDVEVDEDGDPIDIEGAYAAALGIAEYHREESDWETQYDEDYEVEDWEFA